MIKLVKKCTILIMCTLILVISTAVISYGKEDTDPHKTGLLKPTAEQLQWMKDNFNSTKNIRLNWIGKERILSSLKTQNNQSSVSQSSVLQAIENIEPVSIGQEVQTTTSSPTSASQIASALPASVDNSKERWFPPIRNQGFQGSCACFSSTYYQFTAMNALARGWDVKNSDDSKRFSPKWTYNMVNHGLDTGSWIGDAYEVMQKNGVATWSDFSYDDMNYLEWSTNPAVWRNAINYRIDKMGTVSKVNTADGLNKVKQLINNGYVLEFATCVSSWNYKTIKDDPSTSADDAYVGKQICSDVNGANGGHAMVIVGYNDNIWADINNNNRVDPGEKGAFRIANSWGDDGDDGGFIWLSYNAVRNGAFWYNEVYWITAKSSYSPKLLAQFTVNTKDRYAFAPFLGYSDLTQSNAKNIWHSKALDYQGNLIDMYFGTYAFDGTTTACDGQFVLDYSDLINENAINLNNSGRFYLGIRDYKQGNPTLIKAFKLINPQNSRVISSLNNISLSDDSGIIQIPIDYSINSSNRVAANAVNLIGGSNYHLYYTPISYTVTPSTVYWESSNTNVAGVDVDGKVKIIANGTTNIAGKINNAIKVAECTIIASSYVPVTEITLSNTTENIGVGESKQLNYTITPSNATDKTVTWTSSDRSVATVDETGKVTGITNGIAHIFGKANSGNAYCQIDIQVGDSIPVTGITLSQTSLDLTVGSLCYIAYTINPGNATNRSVSCVSSNPDVVSVAHIGAEDVLKVRLVGVRAGTADIKVITDDGYKTATCRVNVSNISVTGITMSDKELEMDPGDNKQLTYRIAPINATNQTVTWTSSNPKVATVGSTGKVTAVAAGTVNIVVRTNDGGKTATCVVRVNASVPVTGITISNTTQTLTVGSNKQLTCTISPSSATNQTVTWTSSNPKVATVGSTGKVTAVAAGTVNIVVRTNDGGKTATCVVRVNASVPVTGITISNTMQTLTVGSNKQLTCTISPSSATNQTVTWTSNNPKVATVGSTGKVTAVAAGTANIVVRTNDGGKTATCVVKVNASVPVKE